MTRPRLLIRCSSRAPQLLRSKLRPDPPAARCGVSTAGRISQTSSSPIPRQDNGQTKVVCSGCYHLLSLHCIRTDLTNLKASVEAVAKKVGADLGKRPPTPERSEPEQGEGGQESEGWFGDRQRKHPDTI